MARKASQSNGRSRIFTVRYRARLAGWGSSDPKTGPDFAFTRPTPDPRTFRVNADAPFFSSCVRSIRPLLAAASLSAHDRFC